MAYSLMGGHNRWWNGAPNEGGFLVIATNFTCRAYHNRTSPSSLSNHPMLCQFHHHEEIDGFQRESHNRSRLVVRCSFEMFRHVAVVRVRVALLQTISTIAYIHDVSQTHSCPAYVDDTSPSRQHRGWTKHQHREVSTSKQKEIVSTKRIAWFDVQSLSLYIESWWCGDNSMTHSETCLTLAGSENVFVSPVRCVSVCNIY